MTAVALLCGLTLALAFPRAGLAPLAWVAPVPWLVLTLRSTPVRGFRSGYAFGLGFFGLLLAWVQRVLAYYTSLPVYLSVPIWALLVGYLAVYPALFGAWLALLARRIGVRALALAPCLWVALELLRGRALGGFPWGLAGYARAGGLPLLQAASVGGITLVSLLTVAVWCALGVFLMRAAGRSGGRLGRILVRFHVGTEDRLRVSRRGEALAAGVLGVVALVVGLGALRLRANPPETVRVSTRQPVAARSPANPAETVRPGTPPPEASELSANPSDKISPASPAAESAFPSRPSGTESRSTADAPSAPAGSANGSGAGSGSAPFRIALVQGGYGGDLDLGEAQAALRDYLRLSLQAGEHRPDLIVWPESNAPFQPERTRDYLESLEDLSRRTGAALLLGSVGGTPETGLTNSAYLIDAGGIRGRYDKRRLVQYGEYVPLQGIFPFIRKFVPEAGEFLPGTRVGVFPVAGRSIGISICYEMIFPEEIRLQARAGSDLLINITNDAWYRWGGPWQHAGFSAVRAIETGLYTLRCASTGLTRVVDPFGRILEQGPLGGAAILEADLPAAPRRHGTVFVRAGDWAGGACVTISMLTLAFLGVGNIIDRRRRRVPRRQRNPRR